MATSRSKLIIYQFSNHDGKKRKPHLYFMIVPAEVLALSLIVSNWLICRLFASLALIGQSGLCAHLWI